MTDGTSVDPDLLQEEESLGALHASFMSGTTTKRPNGKAFPVGVRIINEPRETYRSTASERQGDRIGAQVVMD